MVKRVSKYMGGTGVDNTGIFEIDQSNASVALGKNIANSNISINIGSATGNYFSLGFSGFSHGCTSQLDNGDVFRVQGTGSADGGVTLVTINGSNVFSPWNFVGISDGASPPATTGIFKFIGKKQAGTSVTAFGNGSNVVTLWDNNTFTHGFKADGSTQQTGSLFIGGSVNTNMTKGITINQGAADDEILSLKSSDIAHGITDFSETDTFGMVSKQAGTSGGLLLRGYSTLGTSVLQLDSFAGSGNDAEPAINIRGYKKSGTSVTGLSGDNIILGIRAGNTVKWRVNAQGNVWQSGSIFINETFNTNMTKGITINQGAADDEILSLKSSDITHAFTNETEADTYGLIKKSAAASGGINITGVTTSGIGTSITSLVDIANTSADSGAIALIAKRNNGGGSATTLGEANVVVVIKDNTTSLWHLTAAGNTYQTGSSIIEGTLTVNNGIVSNTLINTQTVNTYTFSLSDQSKIVETNNTGAVLLTVPENLSVPFPVGTTIDVIQYGAGQATFVADSNVTIRSKDSLLSLTGQYSAASLYHRDINEWVLIGDLA